MFKLVKKNISSGAMKYLVFKDYFVNKNQLLAMAICGIPKRFDKVFS
jgi:hypothetical protein